ncbi:hypothetical protein CHS0354_037566, partial [Potamilus streckersoni]
MDIPFSSKESTDRTEVLPHSKLDRNTIPAKQRTPVRRREQRLDIFSTLVQTPRHKEFPQAIPGPSNITTI